MRIHEEIKQGRFPNCTRLAQALEVSGRTVQRDVDFMKDRLQLPIEYDSRRYGFTYSRPVDKFPSVSLTESEIFALLVAHKSIAQYQGTEFYQPLQTAFGKLTGQLDGEAHYTLSDLDQALSFRPFAPQDTDLEVFSLLSRALQQRRGLKFDYKNLGVKKSRERQVHPYHLACVENQWYLFAYDLESKAMRTFILTRLSNPNMTADRFTRPKDFNPDEYLKGSFKIFKGQDDYEVVIEFDPWATAFIRERNWHPTQELIEPPSGNSRVRMRLNNIVEIERWLLSWGTHATVIRPHALVQRIIKTAKDLVQKYENER